MWWALSTSLSAISGASSKVDGVSALEAMLSIKTYFFLLLFFEVGDNNNDKNAQHPQSWWQEGPKGRKLLGMSEVYLKQVSLHIRPIKVGNDLRSLIFTAVDICS